MTKGGLRQLLTPNEIDKILGGLSAPLVNYVYSIHQVREDVYQNIPDKMISHLKYLYANKETITKTDINILEEILNRLSQEIAFVTSTTNSLAKEKIKARLPTS